MRGQQKIRQQIERTIKQRMGSSSKQSSLLEHTNNFLEQLDSFKTSLDDHKPQKNNYLQSPQLQVELSSQRQKLHSIDMQIDRTRVAMLETIKEEDSLKEKLNAKRKQYSQMRQALQVQSRQQLQSIQHAFELKKESMFKNIDQLLQTKNQLLDRVQQINKELAKATKRNLQQQERNKKEIKACKQAFLSIQRQKRTKHEKTRIEQLKEQAIKDTEPKLLAIIKSANQDKKQAEELNRKKVQEFKVSYKIKLEKDLTEAKARFFQEMEQEKQQLRAQMSRKMEEKLQEKQRIYQGEIASLREHYNSQIRSQQSKMREHMQDFMVRNKDSHTTNIEQIKQLKKHYQAQIKKIHENKKQHQQDIKVRFQNRERQIFQQRKIQIDQSNHEKYLRAQTEITSKINQAIDKVGKEISLNKNVFVQQIAKNYEKQLLDEKNKCEQKVVQEKRAFEQIQVSIADSQNRKIKEEARVQQLRKDRNRLLSKNQELQRKIQNHEAQLMAFERVAFQRQKQAKKSCDALSNQLQMTYQSLKQQFLQKEEMKQKRMKELLEQFQERAGQLSEQLLAARQKVQAAISKQKQQLKRTHEQRQKYAQEVTQLKRAIQQKRKTINH